MPWGRFNLVTGIGALASMAPALRLYAMTGFRFIPAYVVNPVPGACILELDPVPDRDSPPGAA